MTDYNSLQRRRNLIVGGFVIVAVAAFIWMLFIFAELPLVVSQIRSFKVLVNFTDAPGVQENTPVQYCGYQVGRVINVSPPFRFRDPGTDQSFHQVKVTLAIERKYVDIPSNVEVKLMKRGLGSSFIVLSVDPDKPVTEFLTEDMELQGMTGVSSEFFPEAVQKKLESLVDSIGMLADNANAILGDLENKNNLRQSLANVTIMTAQATETLKSIKIFTDVGSESMKASAEKLDGTLVEFRQLLAKINDGDGSAGKFVNDGRLYENLLDSSKEMQMALRQLKILAEDAREKGVKIKW